MNDLDTSLLSDGLIDEAGRLTEFGKRMVEPLRATCDSRSLQIAFKLYLAILTDRVRIKGRERVVFRRLPKGQRLIEIADRLAAEKEVSS